MLTEQQARNEAQDYFDKYTALKAELRCLISDQEQKELDADKLGCEISPESVYHDTKREILNKITELIS